jgi:hypothetical protein
MPNSFNFQDLQEAWPDTVRTEGWIKLTANAQPPFVTPRGDVVSGSHVSAAGTVIRGGGTSNTLCWQEAKGVYNVCFDQLMGNSLRIDPVGQPLVLMSGSQNPLSNSVGGYNSSAPGATGYVAGTSGSITTALSALYDGGTQYRVTNLGTFVTASSPAYAGTIPVTVQTFVLELASSGSFSPTDPVTNDLWLPLMSVFTSDDGSW